MSETVTPFLSNTSIVTENSDLMEAAFRSLQLRCLRCFRADMYSPMQQRKWHPQPDTILSYIVHGNGRTHIEGVDKPLSCQEGSCVFVPGGPMRRGSHFPKDGHIIRDVAFIELSVFGGIPFLPFFKIPYVFHYEDADILHQCILWMIAHADTQSTQNNFQATLEKQGIMWDILRVLLKNATRTEAWHSFLMYHGRLQHVLTYISTHMHEALDIPHLCKMTMMSESTLTRTFRAAFGKTPQAYIRTIRLEHAQQLIMTTDASLAQIASMVGYADPFGFSKAFLRHCGMSPRQYRQQGLQLF